MFNGTSYNFLIMWLFFAIFCYTAFYIYKRWNRRRQNTTRASMEGKVAIVTGGTSSVGYETALELARCGARVIISGHDVRKGLAAQDRIIRDSANTNIEFRHLDLQSFRSVHNFVFDIMNSEDRLHVLINNAATCSSANSLTMDCVPRVPQINHFGPFMLTMLLYELMKISKPSRVINVTSVMHHFGKVNPMTFKRQALTYWGRKRLYCDTKLANILFTRKLSVFIEGSGVTANSVHPGLVYSTYFQNLPVLVRLGLKMLLKSPEEGARGIVHLAVAPHLKTVTGRHFVNCDEANPSEAALDMLTAELLWRVSERVVGFHDYD